MITHLLTRSGAPADTKRCVFKVPETNFTLAYVRPDLVLLRVLARNLIM